jgi:hypothetical protein
MNCSECTKLLSAYADGELTDLERSEIERHLETCPVCRAEAGEQVRLRERLAVLRETPSLPDPEGKIMEKVEGRKPVTGWKRFRPALAAVPLLIILGIFLSINLPDSALSPEAVLARAYTAAGDVTSYRTQSDSYEWDPMSDKLVQIWHFEMAYSSPDEFHFKKMTLSDLREEYYHETIVVDGTMYLYGNASSTLTAEEILLMTPAVPNTVTRHSPSWSKSRNFQMKTMR